ncbi:MAG TPA: A/G-specific adenine glycosylase [Candidatus Paceibacterota bacterium]|nr:A/G-specific adenine glycosylase [Candidatus Paceibacterota bacterium]
MKGSLGAFRREVWRHYKKEGRHDLPWRKTHDPYKILVSEVTLQQTQVLRVIPKYKAFLKRFPTVRALAKAPLSAVLKEWSGLGYNRRAKYLHEAAKTAVSDFRGDLKAALAHPLPGVGPYTRAAVRTFAFNEPHTMIETNIRAAYIHHFFPGKKTVSDRDLLPLIERAAEGQDPREWHWALMDYGSHLKHIHPNPTRRSAHYHVQTKFKGSLREIRGEIIRLLATGPFGDLALSQRLRFDEQGMRQALTGLQKDGLIVSEKGSWRIA